MGHVNNGITILLWTKDETKGSEILKKKWQTYNVYAICKCYKQKLKYLQSDVDEE